jgi:hypothetical protein
MKLNEEFIKMDFEKFDRLVKALKKPKTTMK